MWTVLGTLGIVLATIVLGLLADRRWGLLPSAKKLREASAPRRLPPPYAPGEAPATALQVTTEEHGRLVETQRCPRCGAQAARASDEPVTYDGRALRVLAFACARCEHRRSIYIVA